MRYPIALKINGMTYELEIEPGLSLLSALRTELGLTGTKEGCDDSECGACIVLVGGKPVNSCSYLAIQTIGRHVETVEGLAADGQLHPLQQAFLEEGGVQCGFCTPGMLMSAKALIDVTPKPSQIEVRRQLAREPMPLHRLPGHSAGRHESLRRGSGLVQMQLG